MAEAQSPQGPADNAKAAVDPARVFISYASQDKGVAEAVCQAVEQAGMGCWIAPRDVVPGEAYSGAIVHAIDSTKATVLVLSESAAASPHVLREVERAISRRHPVVAFRIDLAPMPVDLEYFLNTSQWLDASTVGLERALPQLIAASFSFQGEHPDIASTTTAHGIGNTYRSCRAFLPYPSFISLVLPATDSLLMPAAPLEPSRLP
jgi:TIR domain